MNIKELKTAYFNRLSKHRIDDYFGYSTAYDLLLEAIDDVNHAISETEDKK